MTYSPDMATNGPSHFHLHAFTHAAPFRLGTAFAVGGLEGLLAYTLVAIRAAFVVTFAHGDGAAVSKPGLWWW